MCVRTLTGLCWVSTVRSRGKYGITAKDDEGDFCFDEHSENSCSGMNKFQVSILRNSEFKLKVLYEPKMCTNFKLALSRDDLGVC